MKNIDMVEELVDNDNKEPRTDFAEDVFNDTQEARQIETVDFREDDQAMTREENSDTTDDSFDYQDAYSLIDETTEQVQNSEADDVDDAIYDRIDEADEVGEGYEDAVSSEELYDNGVYETPDVEMTNESVETNVDDDTQDLESPNEVQFDEMQNYAPDTEFVEPDEALGLERERDDAADQSDDLFNFQDSFLNDDIQFENTDAEQAVADSETAVELDTFEAGVADTVETADEAIALDNADTVDIQDAVTNDMPDDPNVENDMALDYGTPVEFDAETASDNGIMGELDSYTADSPEMMTNDILDIAAEQDSAIIDRGVEAPDAQIEVAAEQFADVDNGNTATLDMLDNYLQEATIDSEIDIPETANETFFAADEGLMDALDNYNAIDNELPTPDFNYDIDNDFQENAVSSDDYNNNVDNNFDDFSSNDDFVAID